MSKKNRPQIDQVYDQNNAENSTRVYFFIAIGALALAAVALGCTFIPGVGVYTLIASVLLELAALSFLSTQKKKNNFKGVFYALIAAYVLLALSLLIFAGGLIYVALQGQGA